MPTRDPADVRFALTAWGRPLREQAGVIAQMALLVPIGTFLVAYPLIKVAGLPARVGLLLGGALVLALFGWVVWTDHRRHPAGEIRFHHGRITISGWGSGTIDVPVRAIRRAVLQQYDDERSAVLVLWIGGRRVHVHERRLRRNTLRDVMNVVMFASERAGTAAALAEASSPSGVRRWQITRIVAVTVALSALVSCLRWVLR